MAIRVIIFYHCTICVLQDSNDINRTNELLWVWSFWQTDLSICRLSWWCQYERRDFWNMTHITAFLVTTQRILDGGKLHIEPANCCLNSIYAHRGHMIYISCVISVLMVSMHISPYSTFHPTFFTVSRGYIGVYTNRIFVVLA